MGTTWCCRRRRPEGAPIDPAEPAPPQIGPAGVQTIFADFSVVWFSAELHYTNCVPDFCWTKISAEVCIQTFKKALIRGLLRQARPHWFLYRGKATDWTWLDNWLLSEVIWFLLALLGTFSASTCWFTFVCRYFIINFTWFWSRCRFQIPGPGVRGHLLYNKCRTCTN